LREGERPLSHASQVDDDAFVVPPLTLFSHSGSPQMFDWIYRHRAEFSAGAFSDIGRSYAEAKRLQDEHANFAMGSNVSPKENLDLGVAAAVLAPS